MTFDEFKKRVRKHFPKTSNYENRTQAHENAHYVCTVMLRTDMGIKPHAIHLQEEGGEGAVTWTARVEPNPGKDKAEVRECTEGDSALELLHLLIMTYLFN